MQQGHVISREWSSLPYEFLPVVFHRVLKNINLFNCCLIRFLTCWNVYQRQGVSGLLSLAGGSLTATAMTSRRSLVTFLVAFCRVRQSLKAFIVVIMVAKCVVSGIIPIPVRSSLAIFDLFGVVFNSPQDQLLNINKTRTSIGHEFDGEVFKRHLLVDQM